MNSASSCSSSGAGMASKPIGSALSNCAGSLEEKSPESKPAEIASPSVSSGNCSEAVLPSSLQPLSSPPTPLIEEGAQTCTDCSRLLPAEAFSRVKVSSHFFRMRQCHPCRAVRNFKAPYARRNRAFIDGQLSKPCKDCGQHVPNAMVFEYVVGPKTTNPASAWRSMSLMNLEVEVSFCDVLCSNCQRRRRARLAKVSPTPPRADIT
jgi:hypothetical protein